MSREAHVAPLLHPTNDLFTQGVNTLLAACTDGSVTMFRELEGRTRVLGREVLGALQSAGIAARQVSAPEYCACGERLQSKGRQARRQESTVGPVCRTREYYYCPGFGAGYYPLDEQLQVARGAFSEPLQKGMALLEACLPFGQAATVLEELLGVGVSAKSAEPVTERRGARLGTARDEVHPGLHAPGPHAVRLGAVKVPFRDAWHEVAVGVAYWVGPGAALRGPHRRGGLRGGRAVRRSGAAGDRSGRGMHRLPGGRGSGQLEAAGQAVPTAGGDPGLVPRYGTPVDRRTGALRGGERGDGGVTTGARRGAVGGAVGAGGARPAGGAPTDSRRGGGAAAGRLLHYQRRADALRPLPGPRVANRERAGGGGLQESSGRPAKGGRDALDPMRGPRGSSTSALSSSATAGTRRGP